MVSRDPERVWIAVYILASAKHGSLYVGVTSDLPTRIAQHHYGRIPGHTAKYGIKRLVWYETHTSMISAIKREKSLKKYRRDWKANLIERDNPDWDDLFPHLLGRTDYERWPELRPKA